MSSHKAKILVTRRLPEPIEARMGTIFETDINERDEALTAHDIIAGLDGKDVLVSSITDKFDAAFSFGPTIFMVKQDVATGITVNEPGPTLASTTITREEKTSVGANFGVDLNYLVTPKIGAGLLVRYTVGSADLDSASESLTVGGFQIGAGVRLRF